MSGFKCSLPLLPNCHNKGDTDGCRAKRRTYRVFKPESDTGYVWTHESCPCNEMIALSARHQVDDGSRFNPKFYPIYEKALMRLYRGKVEPISYEAVVNGYSGARRAYAQRAVDSLQRDLYTSGDAKLRMFLKDDKYHNSEKKPPRCIQYRTKRYGVTMARYAYPMERDMCKFRLNGHRVFAKGRTQDEQASDLLGIWESFTNPVAVIIDESKYDAHYNLHLHRGIRALAKRQCRHKLLNLLYADQETNHGSTVNGTKFTTACTRMSGDQTTGLDNSRSHWGIIASWLELLGLTKYQIYMNGDDCDVFVEQDELHKLDVSLLSNYGMVTKVSYAYEFEHVEFCSTRPVFNGIGYTMVRDPSRILSRIGWSVRYLSPRQRLAYTRSVGLCEAALNIGIPILGVVGPRIAAMGRGHMKTEHRYRVKLAGRDPTKLYQRDISYLARLSMERAYGISPGDQVILENQPIYYDCKEPITEFYEHGGRHPFNHYL